MDILPKARIIADTYSTKLEEIWVAFYDDIVANTTSLNAGNFATKSLSVYSSIANRQEKFLIDLVAFTKAQHPELK